MTTGIAALGAEAVARIVKTIEVYDDFCHANDSYEEHDFGSFEAEGHTIFFKIDLYEESDVENPNGEPVVTRVLTIMLAEKILTHTNLAANNLTILSVAVNMLV